jgi:hypothetical protein
MSVTRRETEDYSTGHTNHAVAVNDHTGTRPMTDDTQIIAPSPIFSDSLRTRSETSLLASLSVPSPRAERVLPAHTHRKHTELVSPITHDEQAARGGKNMHNIVEIELFGTHIIETV